MENVLKVTVHWSINSFFSIILWSHDSATSSSIDRGGNVIWIDRYDNEIWIDSTTMVGGSIATMGESGWTLNRETTDGNNHGP